MECRSLARLALYDRATVLGWLYKESEEYYPRLSLQAMENLPDQLLLDQGQGQQSVRLVQCAAQKGLSAHLAVLYRCYSHLSLVAS